MPGELDFNGMLEEELRERVSANIALGMDPVAAMQKVQADMLANNPWVPPKNGCPVNDLPPELLAHIFMLGCTMQEEEGENEDDDDDDDVLDLAEHWETDDDEEADEDVEMGSPEKKSTTLPVNEPDESDSEDEHDGLEEEDEEPFVPFQVLVSHVCRHWRSIALNTHTLWTKLHFDGHVTIDAAETWIKRANGLPLDITIDSTHGHPKEPGPNQPPLPHATYVVNGEEQTSMVQVILDQISGTLTTAAAPVNDQEEGGALPEEEYDPCISFDDLTEILDLIIPYASDWRLFEVSVNDYKQMYAVLERISACSAAPVLEEFGLYSYDESGDPEETDHFSPPELAKAFLPFNGVAPKLKKLALWAVHLDWEASLSFVRNISELELAYHVRDVRPSFATFQAIVQNSPQLEFLSLCFSGPGGDLEKLEIPSLRNLVLCYLESDYVKPLMQSLVLPELQELTLDLAEEDYTEFVAQLAGPAPQSTRSLLAGLSLLKISCLDCNDKAVDLLMAQLDSLKRMDLNCAGEEERFFHRLFKAQPNAKSPLYCPKLEGVRVAGKEGSDLKKLVIARKAMGVPLKQVLICRRDYVSPRDDKWLRENVETLEYFEASESEDELVDIEGADDDDEGMDQD
ncbi:hypothetical protein MIND_00857500 [Mycena indigotica]|uniref:F-box domain-containing protein n=1 Tax=Mycena indigotica TaxID=2126181 RepID=A0A8H6SHR3_9AGAR|nr:uncharacterized protein MIND_00857500 [Mycena indigotica]KAF7299092.1 hypothetical protein MIND_00857500 [Mycena indigotica]